MEFLAIADRNKLLEEREGRIGVSDLSSVENLDWGCSRKLWYRLRNTPLDFPESSKPEFERGELTEPLSRILLRRRTGWHIEHLPVVAHPDRPWLIAHLDDKVSGAPGQEGPGVAEYKTVHWRVMKAFKKEGIRDSYILQCQGAMAVTGYKWSVCGILCLEPWQFEWFTVPRDEALITKILEDLDLFWAKVENGPTPDALPPNDIRCQTCPWRHTCQGDRMADVSPDGKGTAQELTTIGELLPLASEYRERKELVEQAEELVKETRDQMEKLIGDRPGGVFPGGRVLCSKFKRETWDSKALNDLTTRNEAIKNLLAKYKKTSETSQIRVFWTGDK